MLAPDLLAKIRHIEIHTRRLLSGMQVGDYTTAQKGFGLEFDQIREYQTGDDVRFIDWSGTARAGKMLVRQYLEERNRVILLAVDVSPSTCYGSGTTLKSELMAEIASVLALVADYGKDAVGLICFGKKIEYYLPPARGRKQVHALMSYLLSTDEERKKKVPYAAPYELEQLVAMKHKNALVIVVSDFIDRESVIEELGRVGKRVELLALRCLDKLERAFPATGILALTGTREKETHFFDLSATGIARYNFLLQRRLHEQNLLMQKYMIDCLDVTPGDPFMHNLITFFRRRVRY